MDQSLSSSHINALFSLIEQGDNQNSSNSNDINSQHDLFQLIHDGKLEEIRQVILNNDQDLYQSLHHPNMRNLKYKGRTILQEACLQNQPSIVQFLIEYYTYSSSNGYCPKIDIINQQSYISQDTALHYATIMNNKEIIQILLQIGSNSARTVNNKCHEKKIIAANPNIQNKVGATPLHYVKSYDVAYLLHYHGGADSTIVDKNGLTPLQYIIQQQQQQQQGQHIEQHPRHFKNYQMNDLDQDVEYYEFDKLVSYLKNVEIMDERKAFQSELERHRRMKSERGNKK